MKLTQKSMIDKDLVCIMAAILYGSEQGQANIEGTQKARAEWATSLAIYLQRVAWQKMHPKTREEDEALSTPPTP